MNRLGLLHLAKQNIKRRPFRSVVALASTAVVSAILFSASLVTGSIQHSLQVGTDRLGADLLVVPQGANVTTQAALLTGEPATFYMDRSVAEKVAMVPGVRQVSSQLFLESMASSLCCTGRLFLVGFDASTDFTIAPWMQANLARPLHEDEVVVGASVLSEVGQSLRFFNRQFTVAGTLDSTGMGLDETVFIPLDTAYRLGADSPIANRDFKDRPISAVLVRVNSSAEAPLVAQSIAAQVEGVEVVSTSSLTASVGQQLSGLMKGVAAFGITIWALSLMMTAALFAAVSNERRREVGLLRSMGATKGFVFRLFLVEAGLITGAGGALGVGWSAMMVYGFQDLIARSLKAPYLWPDLTVVAMLGLACLGLGLATGIAASLYPASTSSRLEPYAAIRTGE